MRNSNTKLFLTHFKIFQPKINNANQKQKCTFVALPKAQIEHRLKMDKK
jgi:hypothetical protein